MVEPQSLVHNVPCVKIISRTEFVSLSGTVHNLGLNPLQTSEFVSNIGLTLDAGQFRCIQGTDERERMLTALSTELISIKTKPFCFYVSQKGFIAALQDLSLKIKGFLEICP